MTIQIIPVRVFLLDQSGLPVPLPGFDLVFPRFCCLSRVVDFIPDKARDIMLSREGRAPPFLMVPHAMSDVVRMPAIKRTILLAREKIDVEGHALSLNQKMRYTTTFALGKSYNAADTSAGWCPCLSVRDVHFASSQAWIPTFVGIGGESDALSNLLLKLVVAL